jgi:hypothetical protein
LHFRGIKLGIIILSYDWLFFESWLFLHQLEVVWRLSIQVGFDNL